MPKLSSLTDAYEQPTGLPVATDDLSAQYASVMGISPEEFNQKYDLLSGGVKLKDTGTQPVPSAQPITETPYQMPSAANDTSEPQPSALARIMNRLTGTNGQERYQLWPEKIVRSGVSAAGDALSGQIPQWEIDPQTGDVHTSDQMIERGMDMSAVAGTGGLAGVPEEGAAMAVGSGPFLRPALKHNGKIYKAPPGAVEHSEALPTHLADDFYKKAMSGEDINDYQFGFMNHKGQFLDREKALDYGIKEGLIDPSAGRYGVLTSTMLSDSSKPGVAIESLAKNNPNIWWHGSASGDLRGGASGLHLGTYEAAKQALEARIGIPAHGKGWNGSEEYGKTLLAGQDTLAKLDPRGYNKTGYNIDAPKEDYFPTKVLKYPDGTEMPMHVKPEVAPFKLKGSMSNDRSNPYEDFKANGYMRAQLKKGSAKNGYYYKNVGEDSGSISIVVPNGNHVARLTSDSSKPGLAIEAAAKAEPFYSAVEHQVNQIAQPKMTGDQWLGTLANKPGVKPEELDWIGLKDFLKEKGKDTVTKQEVQDYVNANKVELKEVNKGVEPSVKPPTAEDINSKALEIAKREGYSSLEEIPARTRNEFLRDARASLIPENVDAVNPTKYQSYQLPGGTSYREMLMTLPDRNKGITAGLGEQTINPSYQNLNYKSSHWDEPNILAHVRMNDRMIGDKKSLHLEEIQSDWHQQGRDKGYKVAPNTSEWKAEKISGQNGFNGWKVTDKEGNIIAKVSARDHTNEASAIKEASSLEMAKGVPDAPFKKSWHELALKRMIREAAEKGYDRLSWTPGEAQAARYDLSKSVSKLEYDPSTKKLWMTEQGRGNSPKVAGEYDPSKLPDVVGKEAAEKLLKSEPTRNGNHVLEGQDLKIGGEGMKGFYDSIIPKAVEKIGKEHGVKVQKGDIKGQSLDDVALNTYQRPYATLSPLQERVVKSKMGNNKVHYIDIPQSLKDQAMRKGFPLFSGKYMFTPVNGNPFDASKEK